MDDFPLNQRLKRLALVAQGAAAGSHQRRRAIDTLVREIQACGQLCRPYPEQFTHLYEDIYAEATQRLFTHINEKIEQYRPEHEVMQWVNFLLKRRFFYEARQEYVPHYRQKRENPSSKPWLSLDDLAQFPHLQPQAGDRASPGEELRNYLESDPDGHLATLQIKNRPDVTFQAIALRVLAGYKWQEIAQEFGIPFQTLHGFFHKHLKKLAPQIREYLSQ